MSRELTREQKMDHFDTVQEMQMKRRQGFRGPRGIFEQARDMRPGELIPVTTLGTNDMPFLGTTTYYIPPSRKLIEATTSESKFREFCDAKDSEAKSFKGFCKKILHHRDRGKPRKAIGGRYEK